MPNLSRVVFVRFSEKRIFELNELVLYLIIVFSVYFMVAPPLTAVLCKIKKSKSPVQEIRGGDDDPVKYEKYFRLDKAVRCLERYPKNAVLAIIDSKTNDIFLELLQDAAISKNKNYSIIKSIKNAKNALSLRSIKNALSISSLRNVFSIRSIKNFFNSGFAADSAIQIVRLSPFLIKRLADMYMSQYSSDHVLFKVVGFFMSCSVSDYYVILPRISVAFGVGLSLAITTGFFVSGMLPPFLLFLSGVGSPAILMSLFIALEASGVMLNCDKQFYQLPPPRVPIEAVQLTNKDSKALTVLPHEQFSRRERDRQVIIMPEYSFQKHENQNDKEILIGQKYPTNNPDRIQLTSSEIIILSSDYEVRPEDQGLVITGADIDRLETYDMDEDYKEFCRIEEDFRKKVNSEIDKQVNQKIAELSKKTEVSKKTGKAASESPLFVQANKPKMNAKQKPPRVDGFSKLVKRLEKEQLEKKQSAIDNFIKELYQTRTDSSDSDLIRSLMKVMDETGTTLEELEQRISVSETQKH